MVLGDDVIEATVSSFGVVGIINRRRRGKKRAKSQWLQVNEVKVHKAATSDGGACGNGTVGRAGKKCERRHITESTETNRRSTTTTQHHKTKHPKKEEGEGG